MSVGSTDPGVGKLVGAGVGWRVGSFVGIGDGCIVGFGVGNSVGKRVGIGVWWCGWCLWFLFRIVFANAPAFNLESSGSASKSKPVAFRWAARRKQIYTVNFLDMDPSMMQ